MSTTTVRPAGSGSVWYERTRDRVRDEAGRLRLVEFFLFLVMVLPFHVPGVGLDTHQFMPIVVVLYGLCRRPAVALGEYRWLVVLNALMLVYVGLVSALADQSADAEDWKRRLFRMTVVTAMLWFIASGRIHIRSAVIGYLTGLALNIPAFYAGLASNDYGGYLTGFIGDKNQSGLAYAIFGLLGLMLFRTLPARLLWLLAAAVPLWLTGSRTSLAAFAAGALWILLAPRLSVFWKLVLGLVIYWGVNLLNEDFSQVGVFSDRVGSDALRDRIDDASWGKVQTTGFFGRGLGEAVVHLLDSSGGTEEKAWFFHNSYWSAFVEGGWPWLIFIVAVTVLVGVRPFSSISVADPLAGRIAQGAAVALLVCAWRLGEVFYTNAWAVVLGLAIFVAVSARGGASEPAMSATSAAPRIIARKEAR